MTIYDLKPAFQNFLRPACRALAGVVAVQVGASRRYDGPMGKSDRAFVFGLLGLLIGLGIDLQWWANAGLAIVALLAAWTVVNRVVRGLREIAD